MASEPITLPSTHPVVNWTLRQTSQTKTQREPGSENLSFTSLSEMYLLKEYVFSNWLAFDET